MVTTQFATLSVTGDVNDDPDDPLDTSQHDNPHAKFYNKPARRAEYSTRNTRAATRDRQGLEKPITDDVIEDCQTQSEQLLRELRRLDTS